MIDYNLKAQIIDCGLARLQSQFSKYIHLYNKCYDNEDYSYQGLNNYDSLLLLTNRIDDIYYQAITRFNIDLNNLEDPLVIEAYKVNRASYQRVKRLKDKVANMLKKPCVFLTLTFNEKYYHSTSIETKRKYVRRVLKSLNVPYIANIDYGKKNERIHYHAIVQIEKIDFNIWEYGNLDGKKIVTPNETAISKYICKLTNHAIKETCRGNRLIYSRCV